jgi:hypothetical protein
MQEIWRDVKGFEGIYMVSNLGKVKRLYKGKIRFPTGSPNKNRFNYVYINLETAAKRKNVLLHRLVAQHFIPNPKNKPCVNHIDFNVSHNFSSNLEWCTHKENMQHTVRAGRSAKQRGEKAPCSKLTLKKVRAIREDLEAGMTYMTIARKHGTNYSNVAHIKRGSRWQYSV